MFFIRAKLETGTHTVFETIQRRLVFVLHGESGCDGKGRCLALYKWVVMEYFCKMTVHRYGIGSSCTLQELTIKTVFISFLLSSKDRLFR